MDETSWHFCCQEMARKQPPRVYPALPRKANMAKRLATTTLFLLFLATAIPAADYLLDVEAVGHVFSIVRLAVTPEARAQGLQGCTKLADTEAMAFISFPPRPQVFWMKNTLIPLDLVFLDLEGRVIAIRQMAVEPQRRADESMEEYEERLPRYAIEMPVYCSLEIRHGLAQEIGLKPGDLIPMLSFNALQKAGVRNWE